MTGVAVDVSAEVKATAFPQIVVVRHGATVWSDTGRFTGWRDVPLSAVGRAQAQQLAATLAVGPTDTVLSSDLRRAAETAAAVTASTPVRPTATADLREEALGDWEGLTRDEVAARHADGFARWEAGDIGAFDGREGLVPVAARAMRPVAAALAGPGRAAGRLIVVTHANTALALVGSLLEVPPRAWTGLPCPGPAHRTVLRAVRGRWHVRHHNLPPDRADDGVDDAETEVERV